MSRVDNYSRQLTPSSSLRSVINLAASRYVYCPTGKSEKCPLNMRWKNHFSKYGHPTIVTTTGLFLVFCLDEDETLRQQGDGVSTWFYM